MYIIHVYSWALYPSPLMLGGKVWIQQSHRLYACLHDMAYQEYTYNICMIEAIDSTEHYCITHKVHYP